MGCCVSTCSDYASLHSNTLPSLGLMHSCLVPLPGGEAEVPLTQIPLSFPLQSSTHLPPRKTYVHESESKLQLMNYFLLRNFQCLAGDGEGGKSCTDFYIKSLRRLYHNCMKTENANMIRSQLYFLISQYELNYLLNYLISVTSFSWA
jgi:hypothetical protein